MDGPRCVNTAQQLYEALAVGDRATLADVLHPEFVGRTTEGMPFDLGGTYAGPEDMARSFWYRLGEHYRARAEAEEFHALDDGRLLVVGTYTGVARSTNRPFTAAFNHILEFADGRISQLHQLTDSHAWHEAAVTDSTLETIDFTVRDGVATVCLNRPESRNAIDLRMSEELLEVAVRCAADTSVRAVLFKGAGPALTVGGDITYFTENSGDYGQLFRRMTGPFHEAFRIFSRLDAPIVTAAHGSVAGGGLGFVYAADIVFAAPGTKFATAFAAIGLSGDGGGTWHLPRLVGPRRAAQMYLENKVLDAATAVDWGLITEVVDAAELQERALQTAVGLAAGPTKAFGRMRALLRDSWSNSLSEQLLAETDAVAASGRTADAIGAIDSFTHKRKPSFEGR